MWTPLVEGSQHMPFYPYHYHLTIVLMKQPSTSFSYIINSTPNSMKSRQDDLFSVAEEAMLREG